MQILNKSDALNFLNSILALINQHFITKLFHFLRATAEKRNLSNRATLEEYLCIYLSCVSWLVHISFLSNDYNFSLFGHLDTEPLPHA